MPCFAHLHVGALGVCSGERDNVGRGKLLLRCRLLGSGRRFGAHGRKRRGSGHTVAATRLQLVLLEIFSLVTYQASLSFPFFSISTFQRFLNLRLSESVRTELCGDLIHVIYLLPTLKSFALSCAYLMVLVIQPETSDNVETTNNPSS